MQCLEDVLRLTGLAAVQTALDARSAGVRIVAANRLHRPLVQLVIENLQVVRHVIHDLDAGRLVVGLEENHLRIVVDLAYLVEQPEELVVHLDLVGFAVQQHLLLTGQLELLHEPVQQGLLAVGQVHLLLQLVGDVEQVLVFAFDLGEFVLCIDAVLIQTLGGLVQVVDDLVHLVERGQKLLVDL